MRREYVSLAQYDVLGFRVTTVDCGKSCERNTLLVLVTQKTSWMVMG